MARVPPDGCIVPTDPLADMVREFLDRWNSSRPQTAGRFGDEMSPVRPVAWLSAASGIPEPTIDSIVARRYPTTELRTADAIVTALDVPDALGYPTDEPAPLLPIYPNPAASKKDRLECCGSSEARRGPRKRREVVEPAVAVAAA